MSSLPDWTIWPLAAAIVALFGWFFWHVGASMIETLRRLGTTIQNWPQIRRAMTEAEAKAGGRYPWWFRTIRVLLIVAMIGLCAFLVWRKFSSL